MEMTGNEPKRWEIEGKSLVGPSLSDLAPSPRIRLQIITDTDKALVAVNKNGNRDGVQMDVVTIDKVSGKIQFRMLDVRSDYEELYDGTCQSSDR